jgi:glutamate/tyrosine decarboxylase-like PLP-dependent enzyme
MHQRDALTEVLTQAILRYAVDRMRLDPPPLDGPRSQAELSAMAGHTISPTGLGGLEALRVFADVLAPACISVDHPRFLSFVPAAPTEAAILFDLVVGAAPIDGGSWLEGAGAVFAENEALRWLADLAGLPAAAGGVFVSGGSAGNLSGLAVARHTWRAGRADRERTRVLILAGAAAHSSIKAAAGVMDADVQAVPCDARNRLTGERLATALDGLSADDRERLVAVVATAGTTNAGIVDDLAGSGEVAKDHGLWFHVDAAYGGAALASTRARSLFAGIDQADSIVIDPHKWLFAPFDCAALVYRDPELARVTFTQHAEYLETLNERVEWNASDYAYHLSRRARGLPFWFSLATHGTAAYTTAIDTTLALAQDVADLIRDSAHVELVIEPELSVVMFRRRGWRTAEYDAWSERALASGVTFTVPTSWAGETVLRFCFVNPRTTLDDVREILDSLV